MAPPLTWRFKRRFWTGWQLLRHRLARPQSIGAPGASGAPLRAVPVGEIHSSIPLSEVVAIERIPRDEAPLGMRGVINTGLLLTRWCSPMRSGLAEIDQDADVALAEAGIGRYAKAFRSPIRPDAYPKHGPTDLGRLAVASPYAVLTERGSDGSLQWDLRRLAEFEHQDGLCSLGVRVVFGETEGRVYADRIESDELGVSGPDDDDWARATSLAMCAATTHLSLTRHFLAVHLVSGNHWDLVTRNQLPIDHPVYRLLWPHIYNGFYTNYGITSVQMLPDGDYVNMFSFTHAGLIAYFDAMYRAYDIAVIDPLADWTRRGLDEERFDCPTQSNLTELFEVMLAHATRYLDAYYDDDAALSADTSVRAWLSELDQLVPNGLGPVATAPSKSGLARLIAGYMHEGSVIHDMVGTTLWDYQLWADHNPIRLYRDGRRVPLDVFQRMINNNFALQIRRAPLLDDYGVVALDAGAAELFSEFLRECRELQSTYDGTSTGPWRMEPKNLEINMNG